MRRWLAGTLLAGTVWLCIPSASAGPVRPNSWRPYVNPLILVTVGMSTSEVLVKAGQPANTKGSSRATKGSQSTAVWTYIRTGHNAEVATLTFKGDKLIKIELNLR